MAVPKVPNLLDNIRPKELDVSSFLTKSEAQDYLNDLPFVTGLNDVLTGIFTLFDDIKAFGEQALALLQDLLDSIGLGSFLGDGALSKIAGIIFDILSGVFDMSGGLLSDRKSAKDLFIEWCIPMGSGISDDYNKYDLMFFSLSGLLLGLFCGGVNGGSVSDIYDKFMQQDNILEVDVEIASKELELLNLYEAASEFLIAP